MGEGKRDDRVLHIHFCRCLLFKLHVSRVQKYEDFLRIIEIGNLLEQDALILLSLFKLKGGPGNSIEDLSNFLLFLGGALVVGKGVDLLGHGHESGELIEKHMRMTSVSG